MSTGTRVGTVIEDKFRLDEQIGKGSMGAVYRGTQLMVDRSVAVKLLHPTYAGHEKIQARFEVEARAIARLNHPNCITLYDFGYSEDLEAFYTVVEFIDGAPLESLIDKRPSVARVVDLIKQSASALGHAHHHGILHRDLKPENIMLAEMTDGSEMVKVLDFGIAQIMQSGAEDDDSDDFETERLTRVGEVFGTPPYMSPEQSESTRDLSPATDLYSLGIIFFELLEGRLPFLADTPVEIMAMHRTEDPPALQRPDVPKPVQSLLYQMLKKDPQDRPESGDRIVERLDAIDDADLCDEPLLASEAAGDFDIEPTQVTAPDTDLDDHNPNSDRQTPSTLLGTPPDNPAVASTEPPTPGEESELYELSDIVAGPDESIDETQGSSTGSDTGSRPDVKSTRLVDEDAKPDDTQTIAAANRIAGGHNKMIAAIIIFVLFAGVGAAWLLIEYQPFSMAAEDDMAEVADYATASDGAEPSPEPPESDGADEEPTLDDEQPDAEALPREIAVSENNDDDEQDPDEDDQSSEEEADAEEDEQPPETGPVETAPSPSPAETQESQQPPQPDEPHDQQTDDEQQERPPRLGL